MAHREYTTCPFVKEGKCSVHPDEKGNPQHECVQLLCPVWDLIDELDEECYRTAEENEKLQEEYSKMKEELEKLQTQRGRELGNQ